MCKEIGYLNGDICGRGGCKGVIKEREIEGGCSCHINPPCSYCTTPKGFCPSCGWDAEIDINIKNIEPKKIDSELNENVISRMLYDMQNLNLKKSDEAKSYSEIKYSEDDGYLYQVVRYFDSFREAVQGSNLKLGEARCMYDKLIKKDRYYVTYQIIKQVKVVESGCWRIKIKKLNNGKNKND